MKKKNSHRSRRFHRLVPDSLLSEARSSQRIVITAQQVALDVIVVCRCAFAIRSSLVSELVHQELAHHVVHDVSVAMALQGICHSHVPVRNLQVQRHRLIDVFLPVLTSFVHGSGRFALLTINDGGHYLRPRTVLLSV